MRGKDIVDLLELLYIYINYNKYAYKELKLSVLFDQLSISKCKCTNGLHSSLCMAGT